MKRQGHNGIPRTAGDESVSAIEEEIRRNRADMDHTLEELTRRLEPRRLADDLWETVRERIPTGSDAAHKAQDIGAAIAHRFGAHPIPSAIIGAGLLWMLAEEARGESVKMDDITRGVKKGARRAGEGIRKAGEAAADRARHMRSGQGMDWQGGREAVRSRMTGVAAHAGERMAHAGDRVRGAASQAGDSMRGAASQAGHTMTRVYDDHPIAVGLAAMGVGLLAGVAVPNTRRENEAIGPTVDRVRRRAVDAVEEKADQVASAVEGAISDESEGGEQQSQEEEPRSSTAQPSGRAPPTIPPSPPSVP